MAATHFFGAASRSLHDFFGALRRGCGAGVDQGIAEGLVNEIDRAGWDALDWATWHAAEPAIVRKLLTAGANVNRRLRGWTPLHSAVWSNKPKTVKVLLAAGAFICTKDDRGFPALAWATWDGHTSPEIIKMLRAAAERLKDFLSAVKRGDVPAVQRGLESRADVNGRTPLHWAALFGHLDVALLLLEKGADVNAQNQGGNTPLHSAVRGGHRDMALLLLARGANLNAASLDRRTPLHEAAEHRRGDMALLLLEQGADPLAKDRRYRTARSIAVFMQHAELAALLKGSEEDVQRPRILTATASLSDPATLALTFTTIGGSVAAKLAWLLDTPASQLPMDLISEIKRSGFIGLQAPLTMDNLRLLKPDGTRITWDGNAPSLGEQFGIRASESQP